VSVLQIILGAALLTTGRRLFWMFVGVIGFAAGFWVATQFLQNQPQWIIILIALSVGILGALLAVFLQSLALGAAGFLAGGYVAVGIVAWLGFDLGSLVWVLFIAGGVIGVALVALLFDWGLILLSSFAGANLIVDAINLSTGVEVLIFILLIGIGIAVQARLLRAAEPVGPE